MQTYVQKSLKKVKKYVIYIKKTMFLKLSMLFLSLTTQSISIENALLVNNLLTVFHKCYVYIYPTII